MNQRMKKCAELLAFHPEMTYDEVAAELGVVRTTVYYYRQRPEFKEYFSKLCNERFKSLEALAIQKLKENMENNNQKAIEYLLNGLGYKPADKLEVTDTTIKVEIE